MVVPFAIEAGLNRIIRGDFYPASKQAEGTIVVCHGYKGFKDWGMFPYTAKALSGKYDVITFNFSHNGVGKSMETFDELEKFAHNTYSRELEDLEMITSSVSKGLIPVKETVCQSPLFLLGHSRGAGVVLIHAFDVASNTAGDVAATDSAPHDSAADVRADVADIQGVICWNGISNVDLFSKDEKQEMRDNGRTYIMNARTNQRMPLDAEILRDMEQNRQRFDIEERISTCDIPIAFIQGSEDFERLRKGTERLLARNSSSRKIVIEGGDHTFGAKHPFAGSTAPLEEAIEQTLDFVDSLVKSKPQSQ